MLSSPASLEPSEMIRRIFLLFRAWAVPSDVISFPGLSVDTLSDLRRFRAWVGMLSGAIGT
jgi:hypothetical protein